MEARLRLATETENEAATDAASPRMWISIAIREELIDEAARCFPLETGGVVIGYADSSDNVLVAKAIVGPGLRAVHRRTSFVPDHDFHEVEVARQYRESNRRWTYLGDWHSHPAGNCSLSVIDRRTLGRIARAPLARASRPVMLVLAGGDSLGADGHRIRSVDPSAPGRGHLPMPWQIGCWRLVKRSSRMWAISQDDQIARCRCEIFEE